ncbi:MAG: hypothetical protein WAK96_09680 [Desulfobaccales bacterium]
MDSRVSLKELHKGTQLISDINLLFALDGLFTDHIRSGAGGSPSVDRNDLGAIAENMKLLIDKVASHASWVKETLDAEPDRIWQNSIWVIGQIPASIIFAEKRARFREMVRSGEFFGHLRETLDSITSVAEHTKAEIDNILAEFDQSGSAVGDLWRVGACAFAGFAFGVSVALQMYPVAISIAVTVVGNCM